MKKVYELDIKSSGQTVSVAISEFLVELDCCKYSNTKLIKVITGYGSHGKGGEIKKELLKLCSKLKKENKIKYFNSCEKLTKNYLHNLCLEYPELILDNEVASYNSGVVLVELN